MSSSATHGAQTTPDARRHFVTRALTWVGGVALFFLVGLTVAGVIYRYGFNAPIFGLEDMAKMSMGAVVAAGVALSAVTSTHISVDMLVNLLPERARSAVFALTSLIGIGLCVYAAYALISKGSCGRPCGEFTANLSISHVPIYYALAVAFAIYAVVLAFDIRKLFKGAA